MPASKTRTKPSSNGKPASAGSAAGKAADAATAAGRKAGGPVLTAAAAAAGLAGGVALGALRRGRRRPLLRPRRRLLGVPVESKSAALRTLEMLRDGAERLDSSGVARTAHDIHEIREQLAEPKRRSPVEVVLHGLTHRPGTSRHA